MRVQTRNLEAAGSSQEDVAARVLDALASGMVLHNRKVRAKTGIGARVLSQVWMIKRPVIEKGLVVRLVEDADTAIANAVGRHVYGLRPSDIDTGSLREVCADVYWLGPVGAKRVMDAGRVKPIDLWSALRPSAVNHIPADGDEPAMTLRAGSNPALALEGIKKGEREALAAMMEGLHLVDAASEVMNSGRRAEKRTWRPMRPIWGEDRSPVGYLVDRRVLRHTTNAGRAGFSNLTFQNLSPLLVEAGYDPRDGALGHAYRLDDEWVERVRDRIAWEPETQDDGTDGSGNQGHSAETDMVKCDEVPDGIDGAGGTETGEKAAGRRGDATPRQNAIIAMLEGRPFEAAGEAPSHAEVGAAISLFGDDPQRVAAMVAQALSQVAAATKARSMRGRLWPWRQ